MSHRRLIHVINVCLLVILGIIHLSCSQNATDALSDLGNRINQTSMKVEPQWLCRSGESTIKLVVPEGLRVRLSAVPEVDPPITDRIVESSEEEQEITVTVSETTTITATVLMGMRTTRSRHGRSKKPSPS